MPQNNHSSIDNLIDQAIAIAREAEAGNAAGIEDFVRHYYSGVGEEDLEHCEPASLCEAALAHLKFGQVRKEKTAILRIYNPAPEERGCRSRHTVLEMICDDMPFLVDSLTLALNKYGLDIQLIIHPLYLCKRDQNGKLLEILPASIARKGMGRESFQRFEIERITDPEFISRLEKDALGALGDVRAAVEDWQAMRAKARDIRNDLKLNPPPLDEQVISESRAFIKWLDEDHFTFLGYREYRYRNVNGVEVLYRVAGSGLGILRENGEKGCRSTMSLPKSIHQQTRAHQALIITKANALSTVHRKGHMDYVAVKQFDRQGDIIGEMRFLGLFSTAAYGSSPQDIPLLRHKVRRVMEMSQLQADSHSGKELLHVLDTFPRDELFQSTVEELHELATGILHLQERQRVKLFVRRDPFGRFFSCLVYIPRDRYNTQVRHSVQNILMVALRGKTAESQVQMTESVLARVHYIIHTVPWDFSAGQIPIIEEKIAAAVRTWHDSLKESLIDKLGEEEGLQLFQHYGKALPVAYTEDVSAQDAVYDIMQIKELGTNEGSLRLSLYRPATYPETRLRLKLFRRDELIPIFEALPMLENMGLRVIYERPYTVELPQNSNVFIQDFEVEHDQGELNPKEVTRIFREAFYRTWRGQIENDGFNRLVLKAKLTWRQAALLRACCKYLVQTGVPFSQSYMEAALSSNAEVAGMLVKLFETRFNPKLKRTRESKCATLVRKIKRKLDAVSSLDEDRILRSFLTVINASLRTNYFQRGKGGGHKACISLKLDPKRIPDLPRPVPAFEIFVYSPRVEGVHLRGGKVARGGLRWSDRREDFRTEILGLMKAQMVKNTVIVPVGAKGGFVVKKPPEGDRTALMAEVVDCYRIFVRGLLDLTDNIKEGRIAPPPKTVRHDGDDPYLVVAADKGTAAFSDIANQISQEHNFWLGDAFASGGSEGYDHKKMGITAQGAWESVKRLFREIGIDVEKQDFTVAGIGDMAGDVFGNGMLLSRHIKLQAAFNHMHIFLDPDPDPQKSYAERERLFKLSGSTWEDYDGELISKGGGVFSRQEKEIKLSAPARKMLGVEERSLTPQALISAILRMPVDLLWNGGIGTYCKAGSESNAEVGDRANNNVRIDAGELRCKVVGEGGNLGFTQLARIEYAKNGGRITSDFIDNSGGVNCSDREVNIKILLNLAMEERKLTLEKRNSLLHDMTDEVAALVLKDNYLQSLALSMMESRASERINEHAYIIRILEKTGQLDRNLEYLPHEEEITERSNNGRGLTRPELATLLAYSKIFLYNQLLDSSAPEDEYLASELDRYFPKVLLARYRSLLKRHRLYREIVSMLMTNSVIHRMGPTFVYRMQEETGANIAKVARAYTIARDVFDIRSLWRAIEEMDHRVAAQVQYTMIFETSRGLKHVARWLLQRPGRSLDITESLAAYRPGVATLINNLEEVLAEPEDYEQEILKLMNLKVPRDIAARIAGLEFMHSTLDIVEIASQSNFDITGTAKAYFGLGVKLSLNRLQSEIENLEAVGHWQAVARGTLRENLYNLHRELMLKVIAASDHSDPIEAVEHWLNKHKSSVKHAHQTLEDMYASGQLDFATLSVALQIIRRLTSAENQT